MDKFGLPAAKAALRALSQAGVTSSECLKDIVVPTSPERVEMYQYADEAPETVLEVISAHFLSFS